MGGKTKQSQRTKNNVRPSSSGRSSELLSNAVRMDAGLMSSSTGKVLPVLFPTLAAPLDSSLNPELGLCLKKLNKKDPITKTKALQELCDLVRKVDVEDVVAALASWAHYYRNLTTDTDHKVRESAQVAHGVIASVSGRRLAPQLKALLPPWLQAQYDEYAPSAAAARASLAVAHGVIASVSGRRLAPQLKALLPPWLQAQYDEYAPSAAAARASLASTFPESKLPDVISFCMAEVISHLLENLVGNAEATLSKKILTPEEKELQWNRLLTASLQGLEFFVQHLPSAHDDWLWGELTPLLQSGNFWKMASNKSTQVRAAWFGALGRVAARFAEAFGAAHGARAARLLLAAPPAAPAASQHWGCLLLLLRHLKDDTWSDKKELLVERIIDVLENGGWGDAKHLSSMLLPLLAFLPQHMLNKQFYETFFNAIFKGLEKKSVMSSKSERQSWITSLSECLRYLSLQNTDFTVEVVTAVHRTWLEKALAPGRGAPAAGSLAPAAGSLAPAAGSLAPAAGSLAPAPALARHSAHSMAALAKYWLRQSQEAKEGAEKYDQLARNFWQNIASTVVAQIDKLSTDESDITALVDVHILLLQTLKNSQDTRKPKSIKFDDEKQAENDVAQDFAPQCNASISERYKHNLENVVEKISAQYFEFACKKQVANAVLSPLLTLLIEFDDKKLFLALARHFDTDSVHGLYDKVLRCWLAGDTMRCRAVVDIVFLLMKHLAEDEQDALLDSFKQFPPSVVEWCISLSLSHPHCRLPSVRRWLRSSLVEQSLVAVCKRMINEDDGKSRSLLLMCLATDDDGEIMISKSSVSEIVGLVCGALSPAAPSLERLAGAAAALASELSDCTELAISLFTLQLAVQRGSGLLSVETWCEVRGAWQDAGAGSRQFRARAARAARQQLANETDTLDIQKVEHIAFLCPFLLPQFGAARAPGAGGGGGTGEGGGDGEGGGGGGAEEAAALLKLLFDNQEAQDPIEVFSLRHDCIHSTLNCPLDDTEAMKAVIAQSGDPSPPELRKRDAVAYTNKVVFRAALLRTLALHRNEEEIAWDEDLLKNEYILEQLARVVRDYAVVCSLHDGYAFWPDFDIINVAHRHLTCIVTALTSDLTSPSLASLTTKLTHLAATEGYYYSHAKVALEEKIRTRSPDYKESVTSSDGVKLEDIVTGNGYFHTLQAESRSSKDPLVALRAKYLVMLRSFYLAHAREPEVIDATFISEATSGVHTDPTVIVNSYYRHQHTMLYESDLETAEWRQVVSNTAIVEYLAEMVETKGWEAAAASWDFTTISLCSLTARLAQARWGCPKVVMLARSVLGLFLKVQDFIGSVRAECLRREPLPHVAELPTEWKDIFAPDLQYNLFSIVVTVLDSADKSLSAPQAAYLDALLAAARALDWHALPQQHQNGTLSLAALLAAGARALERAAHPAYKYLAHALLLNLAKPLVLHDAEKLSSWNNEDDSASPREQFAVRGLQPALTRLQDLVDATLHHLKVGEETCSLVPGSASHGSALGALLLADAACSAAQLARGDLVHHYIELFREARHAEKLVTCALRLLPAPVAAHAHAHDAAAAPKHFAAMFLDPPQFSVKDPPSALDIGRLSCRVLRHCARWAGGALRGWWGAQPPRPARALERLLKAYVSPALIKEQLQAVSAGANDLEDAEVSVLSSTNEVVVTYRVEERPLELSIALGDAHPLPPPRVTAHRAPLHSTHWLTVYLAYQNGTVLNAIRMWMDTVAKNVEASPQCYICYCRLQPASGKLPKAVCHQCRNKFHAECLRKWFQTSSKSNCPLCRANF